MFDSPEPYKFVQTNHRFVKETMCRFVHIYKFFIHKGSSGRKYLVEVKEYDNGLFTVDFYAKTQHPEKFRIMTRQFSGGRLGATVLQIMLEIATKKQVKAFGIVAAALLHEDDEANTRRFQVYKQILARQQRFEVFVFSEYSHIFVINKEHKNEKEAIFDTFRAIFKESY